MSGRRSGLVAVLAVGLVVAGATGASGTAGGGPPRSATLKAIETFLNRTEQVLHRRFTATYRISLFPYRRHMFRGRVAVANWSFGKLLFRETPGFSLSEPPIHAYEVVEGSGRYAISCSQSHRSSRWYCISEKDEGMGGEAMQNGAIVPQAFNEGLSNAVADYTRQSGAPYALFLSRRVLGGRPVSCLSVGDPQGTVGRVCTMKNGLIVSYRLPQRLSVNYYRSADLVSYSTKVRRSVLRPPVRPTCPAC